MTALLNILSKPQVEQLHDASLRILENYGVLVEDESMQKLLIQNGCRLHGQRILFSRALITAAIGKAQSRIPFRSRLTGKGVVLEPGTVRTHSTGGAPQIIDAVSGKRRNATSTDMIDALCLMNHLDQMDLPCCLFFPADIPASISQYVQTETMFRYCQKPIYAPGVSTVGNAKYIAELFRLFDPGNNEYAGMIGISPQSPLHLPKEITDVMQVIVSSGVPVSILAAPMAGLTAPITLGGCVAQCHAETLAFTALAYLIRPETPLIFGYRPFFCNMKVAQTILGLPENGMASAMCAQLAAYCGFNSDVYGLSCTSYALDEQTGYEKMYNGLLPVLAGASLITGSGSLASVMCGSLAQLALDNEIFGMIRRSCLTPALDDESLGLEAVENVALSDSSFMIEMHTVMNLRAPDIFVPRLGFDKILGDNQDKEPSLVEKASEQVRGMLVKDETIPLPPELEAEIASIRQAAERELL